MTQKHTPGPWRNDYSPSTGFGCGYGKSQIIAAKGQAIAGVAAVQPQAGPMYRDGGLSQETFDELEANARLIAAAPELLEALKECLALVGNDNLPMDTNDVLDRALAAIAKATSPQAG